MRRFEPDILVHLNKECNRDPIHFVGLGAYDFQLAFAGIESVKTREKAVFSISGKTYSWEEGPADVPVWLLIGQTPLSFELGTPFALRMNLDSGDYVEFHTEESQCESTIIYFGKSGDAEVMEVF